MSGGGPPPGLSARTRDAGQAGWAGRAAGPGAGWPGDFRVSHYSITPSEAPQRDREDQTLNTHTLTRAAPTTTATTLLAGGSSPRGEALKQVLLRR